ncbi:MAG: TonB-dependent receptor plug domain-containing protein, partial [Bacteroidales bacterium]|nr:TonB-dependent receptor plug domain-containing protein [Bacteroidales bacterium]
MKKIYFIILIFSFLYNHLISQTITVIDKTNLKPIENVAIFNLEHTKTALTDKNGKANIDNFLKDDKLFFQHPSYQNITISYNDIKTLNFTVKLTESSINLSEIVISASKWEQNREEIPNKIITISAKEIEFDNPQTTADLLGFTNEVFIQKSQLGGGSPMLRGFAANSILLVIDGVRMNNAIYRSGNLQNVISLDANIIENAEVIFGPGSIIYGSDALGGVMDFHTQNVKLSYNNKTNIITNALMRYSTADNEKTGHVDFNFGRKKWGMLTSISFSDYDDLRMGNNNNPEYVRPEFAGSSDGKDIMIKNDDNNIQKYSGYSQMNIMQKFRLRPNDKFELNYGFYYSTSSDIPRYDRLIQYKNDTTLKYAEWYYGPQKW